MDEMLKLAQSIVEINPPGGNKRDKSALYEVVAREYTTRLPHIRDNTIVIVHTHAAREEVNAHIREGLREEGLIGEHDMGFAALRHLDYTPAELKSASSYKPGLIVKLWQDYMRVEAVDPKQVFVTLRSLIGKGEQEKRLVPEKYGNHVTGIYARQEKALAAGDNITLTKTNKERGYFAKTEYRVTGVDAEKNEVKIAPMKTEAGNDTEITLRGHHLHDLHWDYAYTKTGYGAQGSTREFGISLESTINGKLANLRSFLIAISRAIHHLVIYTDDKAAVTEAISKEKGDKTSAIEAMGKLENRTPAMYVSPAKQAERTKAKQDAILGLHWQTQRPQCSSHSV